MSASGSAPVSAAVGDASAPAAVVPREQVVGLRGARRRAVGPRSIIGSLLGAQSTAVTVHQERCAKVRNRNVTCLKCAEACTSGCISLVEGELMVDGSKCVGCGTCATVCPTCALEARNPSDAELLAACLAAAADGALTVACSQVMGDVAGEAVGAAYVVCAGRVDESLLVGLAAQGVAEVSVLCGPCERCAQRCGRDVAELVAATSRELLEAWGARMRIEVREVPVAGDALLACATVAPDPEVDAAAAGEPSLAEARGSACAAGGSVAPSPAPAHVMADGTLPHFLPDRRERLLDALAALGEPQVRELACRLWGTVVIDGMKCTSCRMCATFCPTGAIVKFDDEDGTFGVRHVPADCVKCGSCKDICPSGAIVLLDEVRTRALAQGESHRYVMKPRAVEVRNNPHQILDTMRQTFPGDLFER